MKLLLDTHLLLWAAEGFEYLPPSAQNDPENELLFSVASLWKVVIKCGLGREDLKVAIFAHPLEYAELNIFRLKTTISSDTKPAIDSDRIGSAVNDCFWK